MFSRRPHANHIVVVGESALPALRTHLLGLSCDDGRLWKSLAALVSGRDEELHVSAAIGMLRMAMFRCQLADAGFRLGAVGPSQR